MLANKKYTQLFGNSEQVELLPVLSAYSGFVPNQVFDDCAPVEMLVFAVIQYLSFFLIKCSTSNIAKNLNASTSAIKNARNSLSKRGFIVRREDGTYSFEKSVLGAPAALVDAKELSETMGYWLPVDMLKSKIMSNQEKKAYSFMKSLTKTKERRMDMNFIASKIELSRVATSRLINKLLNKKLITRHRPHTRSAYIYQYQHGRNENMSIYKKDLSTLTGSNFKQSTQNDTSKSTQNDTHLSINKSNKYYRDMCTEERASNTYKNGQEKSLFFLSAIISFLMSEIKRANEGKNTRDDTEALNAQYTQACIDCDIDKIQELRGKMSVNDLLNSNTEQKIYKHKETSKILIDYEHCLKSNRYLKITADEINAIGKSVKHKVDLSEHENPKTRKMSFCLVFNSFILDLKTQNNKSSSTQVALEICLKKLAEDNYDINYDIIPKHVQRQCTEKPAANENYRNWMDLN